MTESGQSLSSFGLCLAARKSVVDKQMGADPSLPGPGTYINPLTEGRNSNGEVKGVLSTQKNAPSNSFAHHGMKDYGRPIETLNSADRMGPKYDLDNITCGRQVQSRIRTAPSATFGSGAQRQSGGGVSKRGADPSPQHYDTQLLSTGIIRLSTQRGVTGTKFMTGPRTYNDSNARASSASPAPGQYRPQSGIGNQVESKYRGGHSFSIRGGRKDFTAQNAGKQPGPGHYIDPNKEGRAANGEVKVVLSSQRSFASAVFGTAEQRPSSAGLARAGAASVRRVGNAPCRGDTRTAILAGGHPRSQGAERLWSRVRAPEERADLFLAQGHPRRGLIGRVAVIQNHLRHGETSRPESIFGPRRDGLPGQLALQDRHGIHLRRAVTKLRK